MEHTAEKDAPTPPVRVCCGQRHHGAECPDGKAMCCVCFERFDKADLMVENGVTYDVCKGCAPRVTPPADCCCESSPPEFGGNLPDRECPLHGERDLPPGEGD